MTSEPTSCNIPLSHPVDQLPALLYEGEVELRDIDVTQLNGRILADTSPSLEIRLSVTGDKLNREVGRRITLVLPEHGGETQVLITGKTADSKGHVEVSGVFSAALEFGRDEPIGRVHFLLVNFQDYIGEALYEVPGGKGCWAGRVNCEFGKWLLCVDAVRDHRERAKHARQSRGYAITHIARLWRRDNKLFRSKDACDALDFLYWFFTFLNGERSGPYLPVGYRHLNHPVWQQWGNTAITNACKPVSWFVDHEPSQCFQAAQGMYDVWKDKSKRSWLTLAIGLYTEATNIDGRLDIALITSQIILELLASVVLTEEASHISTVGLDKLSAADRVRLLLLWCGINPGIPNTLLALQRMAKSQTLNDGPQIISEIRNALVHPVKKQRDWLQSQDDLIRFEAWKLSLWYIDLIMLKLFKYQGIYNNRIGRTETIDCADTVPWAK